MMLTTISRTFQLELPYEIKKYERNPTTKLAPPELLAIHPLGKVRLQVAHLTCTIRSLLTPLSTSEPSHHHRRGGFPRLHARGIGRDRRVPHRAVWHRQIHSQLHLVGFARSRVGAVLDALGRRVRHVAVDVDHVRPCPRLSCFLGDLSMLTISPSPVAYIASSVKCPSKHRGSSSPSYRLSQTRSCPSL
jgi:hypothetical protein